jgi:RNA polymerase sigma-70 factor (ECF subfamily)
MSNNINDNPKNAEDFIQLLMVNRKSIFVYIMALVHNHSDAEDLMQEVSTLMWRKFSDYQPGTDFVAWGITIAYYSILNYRKNAKTSKMQFSPDTLEQLTLESPSVLKHVNTYLNTLGICIEKLKGSDQELIRRRYSLSESIKEIAGGIGYSVQAVYKNLNRIQRLLIECINQICEEDLV